MHGTQAQGCKQAASCKMGCGASSPHPDLVRANGAFTRTVHKTALTTKRSGYVLPVDRAFGSAWMRYMKGGNVEIKDHQGGPSG